MSNLAKAVPGAGTGDVIDVQSAPTVQPQAVTSPQEVAAHVGSMNVIDPYLRENFFYLKTFSWNTTHKPGHLLYTQEMKPSTSFEQIRYISQLYNAWTGGFDTELSIAGTGFNGGRLIISVLPPNFIGREKDITLQLINTFANAMVDVKTQEGKVYENGDQRSTTFHWNQAFKNDFGLINNAGGLLVVAVQLPLLSGNQGLAAVNVLIRQKLSHDFNLHQMISPKSTFQGSTFDTTNSFLHFGNVVAGNIGNYVSHIKIRTSSESRINPQLLRSVYTPVDYDNTLTGFQGTQYFRLKVDKVTGAGEGVTINCSLTDVKDGRSFAIGYKIPKLDAEYKKISVKPVCYTDWDERVYTTLSPSVSASSHTVRISSDGKAYLVGNYGSKITTDSTGVVGIPTLCMRLKAIEGVTYSKLVAPNGENIMYFDWDADYPATTAGSYMTQTMQLAALAGLPKPPAGEDWLFQLYETTSNRPLGLVRLNEEGFFSTNIPSKTVFTIKDVSLRPHGSLGHNTPMPVSELDLPLIMALVAKMERDLTLG